MTRKALIFLAAVCLYSMANAQEQAMRDLTHARYLVNERQFAEALVTLDQVVDILPDDPHVLLAMGQALAGVGRFEESNRWLMRLNGTEAARASYCLALNQMALGHVPEAMRMLAQHLADPDHFPEKTIRQDPAFASLDNNREWIKLWQSDWYTPLEQQLAECDYLLSQGKSDEAFSLAGNLVSEGQGNPRAWLMLARAQMAVRENRQAEQSVVMAMKYAAGKPLVGEEILRFALASGNSEKVTDISAQLLRIDPTNPEYLIDRALSRVIGGKGSQAQNEILSIESYGIAPAELYYQAGARLTATDPRVAEQYLDRAVESGKLDARYFYRRGLARINLEQYEEALADLAMSLDIDPLQPDLYMARAQVRLDMGDGEGACHDWQRALEMGNGKAADLIYKNCRLP